MPGEYTEQSSFFQNRGCPHFPCHKGTDAASFNCMFCYCPLYALGESCGGNYHYTDKGIKSCINCSFPHGRDSVKRIAERFPELAALAAQKNAER